MTKFDMYANLLGFNLLKTLEEAASFLKGNAKALARPWGWVILPHTLCELWPKGHIFRVTMLFLSDPVKQEAPQEETAFGRPFGRPSVMI